MVRGTSYASSGRRPRLSLLAVALGQSIAALQLQLADAAQAPAATAAARRYLGPLVCSDPSCPSTAGGGRRVNNSNFHLRDVAITAGPDDYYYLTGTSNSAGDEFWTDVWGVVRVWRLGDE